MTLLLAVLLTSSAQVPSVGTTGRLLTDAPIAGISTADQVRLEMYKVKAERPSYGALRAVGLAAFAVAAIVPTWVLAGALAGGAIGLWFSPATVSTGLGSFFTLVAGAIPALAWVAMAVVGAVGIGLVIASFVADAPRQAEYKRLKQLDRTLRRAQRVDVGATVVTF